jgi:hypothetical protein
MDKKSFITLGRDGQITEVDQQLKLPKMYSN